MELYEHAKKVQDFLDGYIFQNLFDGSYNKETYEIMKDFRKYISTIDDFEDTTTRLVIQEYEKIFEMYLPNLKKTAAASLERTYQGMLNQVPSKVNQQLADLTRLMNAAVDTGGLTRQQATREAQQWLKRQQKLGKLKYTHARDSAGRKWRLDYLIKRDIKDMQKKSANLSAERINRQYGGAGVYKITTLADCRDDHIAYQGKYFADIPGNYEVMRKGIITAAAWETADVGEVDGLFGINCRHVKIPIFANRLFSVPDGWNPLEQANEKINSYDK